MGAGLDLSSRSRGIKLDSTPTFTGPNFVWRQNPQQLHTPVLTGHMLTRLHSYGLAFWKFQPEILLGNQLISVPWKEHPSM